MFIDNKLISLLCLTAFAIFSNNQVLADEHDHDEHLMPDDEDDMFNFLTGHTHFEEYERKMTRQFLDWSKKHNKSYSSTNDTLKRMKNWLRNDMKITLHNERYKANEVTWSMAHNEFSDMTADEFAEHFHLYNGALTPEDIGNLIPVEEEESMYEVTAADSVARINRRYLRSDRSIAKVSDVFPALDWEESGIVTDVKSQGGCGSCWAFALVAAMESVRAQYIIANNITNEEILVDLSEQELVDCAGAHTGNYGCNGGWPTSALKKYVKLEPNGLCSREQYPYEGTHAYGCRKSSLCSKMVSHTDFTKCSYVNKVGRNQRSALNVDEALDETVLITAVVVNPVDKFMNYDQGIFNDPECGEDSDTQVNHALLLVGRGYDEGTGKLKYAVSLFMHL